MGPSFNPALFCCTFVRTREWRNGRRAGLRIQCRKACGFKSRLSHELRLGISPSTIPGKDPLTSKPGGPVGLTIGRLEHGQWHTPSVVSIDPVAVSALTHPGILARRELNSRCTLLPR
jgi:hypothetical protein